MATNRSFFYNVSICNQNQSISLLVIFRENTKVIALLFSQQSLIFITFQSAIKINQFQCWSFFGKIPRVLPYFLAKNRSFSSLSICNQNQSISMLVIFRQNTKVIALPFGQKSLMFLSCFNLQSKSINVNVGQFSGKHEGYNLTVWPKIAHFLSCFNLQSKSINFNFGQFLAKYQGYSLTFWPKIAQFHHFSICNKNH